MFIRKLFYAMKIYKKEPDKIVRVEIYRVKEKREYVNLIDTSVKEVKRFIIQVIEEQNISPFVSGYKTSIQIREAEGGRWAKGKGESLSFRGLSPQQIKDLVIQSIESNEY